MTETSGEDPAWLSPASDYAVEASSDLAPVNWTAIATSLGGAQFAASGGTTVVETGDGSVKTVTVQTAPPGGNAARFLRVRVSLN